MRLKRETTIEKDTQLEKKNVCFGNLERLFFIFFPSRFSQQFAINKFVFVLSWSSMLRETHSAAAQPGTLINVMLIFSIQFLFSHSLVLSFAEASCHSHSNHQNKQSQRESCLINSVHTHAHTATFKCSNLHAYLTMYFVNN